MKLATDIYFAQMRSLIDLYSNARDSLPQNQKFTFSLLCGAVNADNSLTPKHSGWIKCTRGKRKNELLVLGWNVPLYLFICTRGNSRTPLTTGSNCRVETKIVVKHSRASQDLKMCHCHVISSWQINTQILTLFMATTFRFWSSTTFLHIFQGRVASSILFLSLQ